MFIQPYIFIVQSVSQFLIALFILRFLMQVVRISFQQPLGQFVVKMTNWLVLKLRKFIPGFMGYDIASLVGGLLIGAGAKALIFMVWPTLLHFNSPLVWLGFALHGVLELIRVTLYCLVGAVIVQSVLSWTNPYHPFSSSLSKLTGPLLRPIQRFIPPVAGVDLSPWILLLVIQVLLMSPVAVIARQIDQLFQPLI